tara:strand:- start:5665 stop:6075 length:411 start_codon:yes stop_codon:yes gene_type:complete
MPIYNSSEEFFIEIAKSADLCFKPLKHSVLNNQTIEKYDFNILDFNEIILKIECRNTDGVRCSENDLDLEIFRSGDELNIILSWHSFPLKPILWQGKHSLWMDANTGKRTTAPVDGVKLEAFSRRLRSKFSFLILD